MIWIDTLRPNQEGTLTDISPELLQLLLSIISYGKHTNFNLTDIVYSKFVKKLCRDFPRDHVPLILTPLLYLEESEVTTENILSNSQTIFKSTIMDTSWSNLIMEIGKHFHLLNCILKVPLFPLFLRIFIHIICGRMQDTSDERWW